jgi:hypothetical protein
MDPKVVEVIVQVQVVVDLALQVLVAMEDNLAQIQVLQVQMEAVVVAEDLLITQQ